MQSLEYDEVKKTYDDIMQELNEKLPDVMFEGKPFKLEYNVAKQLVYMNIDGMNYVLTQRQAIDLGNALHLVAHRIDKKKKKGQGR